MIEGSEGSTLREESEITHNSTPSEQTRASTGQELLAVRRLQRLQNEAQIPLPFSDEQVQIFESLPPFLKKLYKILAKGAYAFWNSEGTSFYIARPHEFAVHVLPNFFNHSNLNSFIRQLNVYGFHKIRLPDKHTELLCYQHPHFLINDFDDMLKIKRNGDKQSKRPQLRLRDNEDDEEEQVQEELKTPHDPFLFPTKRPRTIFQPNNFAPHYRLLREESPPVHHLPLPAAEEQSVVVTPDYETPGQFGWPRKRVVQPEEPKRRYNKRGRNKQVKQTEQMIDELSQQLQRVENERDALQYELQMQKEETEKWRARALETEANLNSFVKKIAQNFNISPLNIEGKFVEEDEEEEGERVVGGDSLINFGGFTGRAYQTGVTDPEKKQHFKIKIVILDEVEEQAQAHNLRPLTSQEEVSPEIEFISSSHSEEENEGGQTPELVAERSFRFQGSPGVDQKDEMMSVYYPEEAVYYGGGMYEEPYDATHFLPPMPDVTRDCSYLENGGGMLGARAQPAWEWGE